jgi:hypothetical protein
MLINQPTMSSIPTVQAQQPPMIPTSQRDKMIVNAFVEKLYRIWSEPLPVRVKYIPPPAYGFDLTGTSRRLLGEWERKVDDSRRFMEILPELNKVSYVEIGNKYHEQITWYSFMVGAEVLNLHIAFKNMGLVELVPALAIVARYYRRFPHPEVTYEEMHKQVKEAVKELKKYLKK